MSVAGGRRRRRRAGIEWSRLVPSTSRRCVAASGSRSGGGIERHRTRRRGARLRSGDGPPPAGRSRRRRLPRQRAGARASPRSWPIARPAATTSSTSPTTRCTTGPTTRPGSRRWAPRSRRTRWSRRRARDGGLPARATTRRSGACWSWAPAGSSASCATRATTWSAPGTAATRMSQEGIDGFAAAGQPDAVVVGLDPNLTYAAPGRRLDCIRAGRAFHRHQPRPGLPDRARPAARGRARSSSRSRPRPGVVPVSIGKPAPYLLEAAAHAVGREPAEAIMIGDGIGTDLAAARAVGARCIFMLTGVTTRAQVEALPAGRAADRDRRRRRRARGRAGASRGG